MFLITPRIVLHDAYPSVESRVSYPGGGPETPAVVPGGATRIRLNELEIRSE